MKNDDPANIPGINTISPISLLRDHVTKATSSAQASSSSSSSGSSASDLRQRLQDLPSSDEFTPLADRVTALGRRISRKREFFLRLHGAANRIEESDEWEEREEKAEAESSLEVLRRPMDARARRRAHVRLGSSRLDDKAMVISRSAGPFKVSHCDDDEDEDEEDNDGDNNHDKLNPVASTAARSTQECDYSRLPAIEPIEPSELCRQPRPTSLSEPSTARFPRRINIEARDVRSDAFFALRDSHSRSADLQTVSPFSFSHVRPKRKIGGYRPTPGVFLRNLSSGSESGSVKETNRCHPSVRKIDDPIATLELSSPEFKPALADKFTKKMPIMSARSDITESILPNLLPSISRRSDDRQVHRNDSRHCTEFEDSYDEEEESYHPRLITSKVHHDDVEDRRFGFDCSITRFDNDFCKALRDHSPEIINKSILDTVEKPMNTYLREANDSPRLTGRIPNDITEEALSSQTSEPFGSEDHSRSSHTPKMHRQKEVLSNKKSQNDIDVSDNKYDQDIVTVTNVPILALNSQDISCSTSAYSRECSAVQSLDPHELIEALSAVSLQQGKEQRDHVRKHEDFQGKDTINASCRVSCPIVKGETWRIPKSSTLQLPGRVLSCVPSRIPVRVPSSKVVSSSSVTKLSGCCAISEISDKIANYEEARLTDPNNVSTEVCRDIIPRQLDVDSYCRVHEQDSLPRKNSIEDTIVETRSNIFMLEDEETECEVDEHEHANLSSLNPLSLQNAEFEDDRRRAQFPPENRHSEKSCPLMFYPNELAFPGDRDFSKIDDVVQSRSDRSTPRKSAENANVMKATESPYLLRCMNDANTESNRSSQVKSTRNARENVTWRTEDEWASNNDGKPDVMYLRTMKCFESTVGEVYDSSLPETSHLLRSNRLEVEKIVKEQEVGDNLELRKDESSFDQNPEPSKIARPENSVSQLRRTQGTLSFATRISSSTLDLNSDPKRKKRKSQERFPFTISEASAALSTKRESMINYQVPDKDLRGEKMDDQMKKKTTHQLKMHPSITRLANAGLEDTVADILCCVAQNRREDKLSSRSKIKGFMQMFSSKFRTFSKQRSNVRIANPTEVIYENQACQVDSRANSCSEHSSVEETHGTNRDKFSDKIAHRVTRSNPTLVFGEKILTKTSSLTAIPQDHPHRRHDRDDLWVRGFKEAPLEIVKNSGTLRKQDQNDSKNRYSIFLAENLHSDKVSVSNIDCCDYPEVRQQHDILISGKHRFHEASYTRRSKRSIDVDIIPEIDEIEVVSGCLCLRLCRLITSSKHRLSTKEHVQSPKFKNSGPFL